MSIISKTVLRLTLFTLMMVLSGCATLFGERAVRLNTQSVTQRVALQPSQAVIVKCNCNSRSLSTGNKDELVIKITGRIPDINKPIPSNINNNRLRFSVKESQTFVVMQSQEYAYRKDAYVIDHIHITVPAKTPLHILPSGKKKLSELDE